MTVANWQTCPVLLKSYQNSVSFVIFWISGCFPLKAVLLNCLSFGDKRIHTSSLVPRNASKFPGFLLRMRIRDLAVNTGNTKQTNFAQNLAYKTAVK